MTLQLKVTEFCELHGQCVGRVPEVFRFGDGDVVEHETEVTDPEAVDGVRDAQFLCPAQAIEIIEVS